MLELAAVHARAAAGAAASVSVITEIRETSKRGMAALARAERNQRERGSRPDAPTRNRTENLLIKSQLLCQLSYRRAGGNIVRQGSERKLSRLCVCGSVPLVLPCPQGESNPCSHLERVVS